MISSGLSAFYNYYILAMDRLFVDVDHLMKGILKGAPQSAMELSPERYTRIKEMGGIDGRFAIH